MLVARGVCGERLRGVDLVVRRGEIVGLAGLAGSGARELLLTIAGAVPWDRGEIELNGRALRSGSTIRSVGAGAGLLVRELGLCQPGHDLRRALLRLLQRHVGEQEGELVAAVAGHPITGADQPGQGLGSGSRTRAVAWRA